MKQKKIIFGITAPQSVDMLHGQLSHFAVRGYKVYLMGPKDKRTREFCINENGVLLPVSIEREISPIKDFIAFIQIIKHILNVRPDVVNLGTPKMAFLGMIAAKLLGVRFRLFTYRGLRYEPEKGLKRKMLMFMERTSASFAHKVFCISKSLQEKAVADGVLIKSNHFTIGVGSSNGVDTTLFDSNGIQQIELQKLREKYNLQNSFTFGFAGRLVDRKGINEIYGAFNRLFSEKGETKLLIVGRPNPSQIGNPEIIEKYANHPGIVMTGLQPFSQMPLFMAAMDVFVMPGWGEGFGAVYLQAAAMGKPVISAESTGCKDAVSHGFNGFLIEPGNENQLYDYMKSYLCNQELVSLHSSNSLEWVQNFKPQTIHDGLYSTIEENL